MTASPAALPRLPVFGWQAFSGPPATTLPSVLDAPHVLLTTSGRAAIALALRVLGVQAGERVLVPTYHCPTMVAPVVACGAHPAFYPIDTHGHPCMDWLGSLDLSGVRAILVAHYFGVPQALSNVRAWCDARGIALIEDCAHALFGSAEGRPVGQWGDVAIASLTKFLPVQEGGVLASARLSLEQVRLRPRGVLTELKAALDMLELGATHGRLPGLNGMLRAGFGAKRRLLGQAALTPPAPVIAQQDAAPGYSEVDNRLIDRAIARACAATVRLALRERIVQRRRANFDRLARLLGDLRHAAPLYPHCPPGAAPYVFPLRVANADACYRVLRASGLPLFRWDWIWPDTARIEGDIGRRWSREILQLPCHQDLVEDDLGCIAATVRSACEAVG